MAKKVLVIHGPNLNLLGGQGTGCVWQYQFFGIESDAHGSCGAAGDGM